VDVPSVPFLHRGFIRTGDAGNIFWTAHHMHYHLLAEGYSAKLNKFVDGLEKDVARLPGIGADCVIKKPTTDVVGLVPYHLCSTVSLVVSVATCHNQTQPSVKLIRSKWLDALCKLCTDGMSAIGGELEEISKVDSLDGLVLSVIPSSGRVVG